MSDRHPDHAHSLADDLKVMETLMARRRALKWFAGAGTAALVAGCGGSDAAPGSVAVVSGSTASATPTPTASGTSAACIADPAETAGPYPGDGTNTASGGTSNILTVSGVVRSDIRPSFLSTTTVATGVLLKITLTLVDVNATCAPLAGYAVYLWHCDRQGLYSLYTAPAESYLRGVQVTDANGQVSFTTIFPGCYDGRWPHMHFEVFSSLSNALGGRYAVLTSQLAMPSAACSAVYADATTYPSSAAKFARISLSSDGIFGDNSAAQVAQQTPVFSGNVAAGYDATTLIGIAR
ncbi:MULTISPECIES: intradiol ring-cleavage dioxygenase [unclassified Sphingomonas]|uniref:intradiol ring-cleavage dioxygenase n=1 Tax=unclassified Sphingomonas TaxID=196159 RepID=UPI00285E77B2|nr:MULTISPECIES: intradiol ring-cleavage dioxygenase [unclassified Sphingomonas]MDR6116361.1 protocatechuate 3,4-dioxygenase beta subunit [Sphingomonas sp. SORGH_AS_0789]MDR6149964.1 protocatechuate 3,4-dioxygenase beta subunit [Sphingomonas sp. SORGH_AS_0742]